MKILNVIVLAAIDNFHFDAGLCTHSVTYISRPLGLQSKRDTGKSQRKDQGKEIFMHQKARMLSIVQWTLEILRWLKLAPRKGGVWEGISMKEEKETS